MAMARDAMRLMIRRRTQHQQHPSSHPQAFFSGDGRGGGCFGPSLSNCSDTGLLFIFVAGAILFGGEIPFLNCGTCLRMESSGRGDSRSLNGQSFTDGGHPKSSSSPFSSTLLEAGGHHDTSSWALIFGTTDKEATITTRKIKDFIDTFLFSYVGFFV